MEFESEEIKTSFFHVPEPVETRDHAKLYDRLRRLLSPEEQELLADFYDCYGLEMRDRTVYFFQKGFHAGRGDGT